MLMLIIGIMFIYLIWTMVGIPKKKTEQRKFRIRKHRKETTEDEEL
jgi:hypothetical protein